LLVAAIVLPCTYLAVMAYHDLRAREGAASDVTMRTVRVAEEQALKVSDLNETLDARIVDLVQDPDDDALRRAESDIHDALNTIGGGYPQVAAVSIFGASGKLLANSLYYPAPHASIANRDDFADIRDGRVIEHISRLIVNARDAMPASDRLKVGAQNITFRREDGFHLTGDFVRISLDDTGSGMALEVLARAFEPLFTTKPKGMGTGLGLCRRCSRSAGARAASRRSAAR